MEYVGAKEFGSLDDLANQGKEPLISKPNLTYMLHQIPGGEAIKLRLEWDYHGFGATLSFDVCSSGLTQCPKIDEMAFFEGMAKRTGDFINEYIEKMKIPDAG